MLQTILGRKVELGMNGDAIVLKAWCDGVAVYGEFVTMQGVKAWIRDNRHILDTLEADIDTVKVIKVFELNEVTGELIEVFEAA